MPHLLAMDVAAGRMPLNEALERMAQADAIERLMRAHDLSRALATQVVLGHADLSAYLLRRRFEQARETHGSRSVVEAALAEARSYSWSLCGAERVEAKVVAVGAYEVELMLDDGTPRTVHKLELKYAYPVDAYKRVKKSLRRDKALSASPRRPARRPQDRFTCSDRRLFDLIVSGEEVSVVTLEGDVIDGSVRWFSRYEFALAGKGDDEIVVFRHALHRIVAAA